MTKSSSGLRGRIARVKSSHRSRPHLKIEWLPANPVEQLPIEVRHDVAEADDLENHPRPLALGCKHWLAETEPQCIVNPLAELCRRYSGGKVSGDGSEDVSSMKRPADRLPEVIRRRDFTHSMFGHTIQYHTQDSVIGANESMPAGFRQNRPPCAADAGCTTAR